MVRAAKIVRNLVPTDQRTLAPVANDNGVPQRAGIRCAVALPLIFALRWAGILFGALYIGALRASVRMARWARGGGNG